MRIMTAVSISTTRPNLSSGPYRVRGFSLIELMIALVLGLIVIGGATAVLLSNKQSYRSNEALSRIQENSRVAFELMSRDMFNSALTGCGNAGRVANVLNDGSVKSTTPDWYADFGNAVVGYGGTTADPAVAIGTATTQRVTGTDALTLIGAADTGYSIATHTLPTGGGSQSFTIRETSPDLKVGDIIIACDPDHAVIAQITSITGGAYNIETGTTHPGNCSTGLGFPTQCTSGGNSYQFGVNSLLSKLKAVSWYVGNNRQGGKSLYRMALINNAGTPTPTAEEIVRDVINLTLRYHLSGGTTFVDAATVGTGWNTVDAVQATLRLQATDKTAGTAASQPIIRDISATVTLRNRVN